MKRYGILILVAMVLLAMVASFGDFNGGMSGYATAAGVLDDNSLMKFRYKVTATPREINHSVGVTNAIQTQLDAISAGTGTTLADSNIFVGSSSGVSAPQTLSLINDVTGLMNTSGIINATIPASTITSAMITNGVVDPVDLTAKSWQIMVAGSKLTSGGDTTELLTNHQFNNTNLLFTSFSITNDTDSLVTVTNSDHSLMTTILSADPSTDHSYDYVGINNNPSIGDVPWQIVGAFNATTAGGDADEAVTVTGSLPTDIVVVSLEDDGANDITIAAANVTSAGTVIVNLSADPATAAVMSGIVVRPNSTDDLESHSIVFAGSHTTAGGAAVEEITVTGVLATDIVIAMQNTKVAQQFEYAHAIANTVRVTFNADPGADEVISWMVLRAN